MYHLLQNVQPTGQFEDTLSHPYKRKAVLVRCVHEGLSPAQRPESSPAHPFRLSAIQVYVVHPGIPPIERATCAQVSEQNGADRLRSERLNERNGKYDGVQDAAAAAGHRKEHATQTETIEASTHRRTESESGGEDRIQSRGW